MAAFSSTATLTRRLRGPTLSPPVPRLWRKARRIWQEAGLSALAVVLALTVIFGGPPRSGAQAFDGPLRLSFDLDSMTFEADALQREGEDGFLQLTGNVLLEDEQVRLQADTLLLDTDRRQARAVGNVRVETEGSNGEAALNFTAQSLSLDQATAGLLLDGLALRLREQAIIAATRVRISDGEIALDHVAYTACEAPCNIDDYRGRDPLPWRLTARRAVLDQTSDTLRLYGVRLRLFEVPVLALPYLAVPSPEVSRKTGLLAPMVGFRSGEGGHLGVPLYAVLGPSADTTLTPVFYTDGRVRLDTELRLALPSLSATGRSSTDTTGAMGGQIRGEVSLLDAPETNSRLSLDFDWTEELEPGQWQALDQTGQDLALNRLGLTGAWGHSFTELAVLQDQVLMAPEDRADEGSWLSGWDESLATRARVDLRLPPLPGGGRLRLAGQGLAWQEQGWLEASAGYSGPLITNSGLVLAPELQAGAVAEAVSGGLSPWLGGQMRASLPLTRSGPYNVASLTPQLAVTGLTGADLSTEGIASPLDANTDVLSRASLFDLRSGSDPFGHDPDIRLDAALDFALYPTGQQNGDLGLRGSLGQRLSWSDAALSPTLAALTIDAGGMQLDLNGQIDTLALIQDGDWSDALPRLSVDLHLPLSENMTLRGRHARLQNGLDTADVTSLGVDLRLGEHWTTTLGMTTRSRAAEDDDGEGAGATRGSLWTMAEVGWNFAGDWVAETAVSQNVLNPADQDLSFDIYHRCDCLTAQFGLLRERDTDGSEYKARVALSLPTLFSQGLTSPTLFRHQ